MRRVGIGVVGCGNISAAYLKAMAGFPILDIKAIADLDPAAAQARAAEFGLRAVPLEIYGTEGSLVVPDPNYFGGQIQHLAKGGAWTDVETDMPYADGNYRSIGLADMAHALREGRPHRASGALALHVLEVMEAVELASASGSAISIATTVDRPQPLAGSLVDGRLA